jgi:RNA polymerase sigma-70 factor, ECF subfamily
MMIEKPNLNLFTDEMLWELVTKDSRKAFMAIYDRYSTNLYIYIIQIVSTRVRGKQLEEDTKEIIIQVFETLWINRLELPQDIRLEEYLFMSAYRHALNYSGLNNPGIQ